MPHPQPICLSMNPAQPLRPARRCPIDSSCGVAAQPELSLLGGAHPLPEVEVVLATLWTVASWRGVYAAYRTWANFF